MKNICSVFTALIVVLTFTSCNNDMHEVVLPNDNIIDANDSFIHLDTDVSTRGKLVVDETLKDAFGVYGYVYRSTWDAARAQAKPNVFDEAPQKVTYQDNYYSYGKPKQWTGYNYAFYAYYPYGANEITAINEDVEGEPYILYNLPQSENPTAMIDVMTASYVDTNANSSKTVPLHFYHRLAAVDVGARCYYDYDPNPDNNTATDVVSAAIEIAQIELKFTNLKNTQAKIYLNREHSSVYSGTQIERTFRILTLDEDSSNNILLESNADGDTSLREITSSKGDNATTMILIPQTANIPEDDYLSVIPTMAYYLKLPNGQYIQADKKSVANAPYTFIYSKAFKFDRPILEGRRYFIQFNFTSDAVSVNIVAADEWDVFDTIYHDFE